MKQLDIVRAWKDEGYRAGLSDAELAQLPDHPVGMIELTDADLEGIAAGLKGISDAATCTQGCVSIVYSGCGYCFPKPE